MKLTLLLTALSFPVICGIVVTWLWARRREKSDIVTRLSKFAGASEIEANVSDLLKGSERSGSESEGSFFADMPALPALKSVFAQAALEHAFVPVLGLVAVLFVLPIALSIVFGFHWILGLIVGLVLSSLPLFFVKSAADARRQKFCQLLPDAIDLMVAVLRSGHSIPQAVQAVSQELASPIAEEFEAVVSRMSLGQPLYEALSSSSHRFQSYELELIRVAIAIQSDVGGSLAELLDKTNATLRERLKLSRQLRVITTQSRLSAQIVGTLPIILALGLNFLSPGYLQLLAGNKIGQVLIVTSILLLGLGIFTMRKMSTMRV